jgi:hypothetical protein
VFKTYAVPKGFRSDTLKCPFSGKSMLVNVAIMESVLANNLNGAGMDDILKRNTFLKCFIHNLHQTFVQNYHPQL